MEIGDIDKNLKVETDLPEKNIDWYNSKEEPFEIYGLYNPQNENVFKRIPTDVAKATSEGVGLLHTNTAGGRVRFSTNSRFVAIKSFGHSIYMNHMPSTGHSGFDLYIDDHGESTFNGIFIPPQTYKESYENIVYLPNGEKSITINFPLYNDVCELYIGLDRGSSLSGGEKYKYNLPVVYYGSSITQGGCASRPGNAYQSMISRKLNCDHINLGFSGNGRAEKAIVDYIASLQMSVLFMDYDHNAPNAEYLKATHESMYLAVREKHPNMPIIFASRTDMERDVEGKKRRDIIYETYMNAMNNGDQNVYYIDGQQVFGIEWRDSCTVDGCHPNDLGFMKMAEYFIPYVKNALETCNK